MRHYWLNISCTDAGGALSSSILVRPTRGRSPASMGRTKQVPRPMEADSGGRGRIAQYRMRHCAVCLSISLTHPEVLRSRTPSVCRNTSTVQDCRKPTVDVRCVSHALGAEIPPRPANQRLLLWKGARRAACLHLLARTRPWEEAALCPRHLPVSLLCCGATLGPLGWSSILGSDIQAACERDDGRR